MIFALQTSFLNPSPQLKLTINDTDTPFIDKLSVGLNVQLMNDATSI